MQGGRDEQVILVIVYFACALVKRAYWVGRNNMVGTDDPHCYREFCVLDRLVRYTTPFTEGF